MSRYKFERSREFIPGDKFGGWHWRSVAVQIVSEPEIYHGTGILLRADARVRVQITLQIYLGCRSKSKKCDKQLTFIVRVSASFGQVTQKLKKTSGAIRQKKLYLTRPVWLIALNTSP